MNKAIRQENGSISALTPIGSNCYSTIKQSLRPSIKEFELAHGIISAATCTPRVALSASQWNSRKRIGITDGKSFTVRS